MGVSCIIQDGAPKSTWKPNAWKDWLHQINRIWFAIGSLNFDFWHPAHSIKPKPNDRVQAIGNLVIASMRQRNKKWWEGCYGLHLVSFLINISINISIIRGEKGHISEISCVIWCEMYFSHSVQYTAEVWLSFFDFSVWDWDLIRIRLAKIEETEGENSS